MSFKLFFHAFVYIFFCARIKEINIFYFILVILAARDLYDSLNCSSWRQWRTLLLFRPEGIWIVALFWVQILLIINFMLVQFFILLRFLMIWLLFVVVNKWIMINEGKTNWQMTRCLWWKKCIQFEMKGRNSIFPSIDIDTNLRINSIGAHNRRQFLFWEWKKLRHNSCSFVSLVSYPIIQNLKPRFLCDIIHKYSIGYRSPSIR